MKYTFVVTARDPQNRIIKTVIQAGSAIQAKKLFESAYSSLKIQSVIMEQYASK